MLTDAQIEIESAADKHARARVGRLDAIAAELQGLQPAGVDRCEWLYVLRHAAWLQGRVTKYTGYHAKEKADRAKRTRNA